MRQMPEQSGRAGAARGEAAGDSVSDKPAARSCSTGAQGRQTPKRSTGGLLEVALTRQNLQPRGKGQGQQSAGWTGSTSCGPPGDTPDLARHPPNCWQEGTGSPVRKDDSQTRRQPARTFPSDNGNSMPIAVIANALARPGRQGIMGPSTPKSPMPTIPTIVLNACRLCWPPCQRPGCTSTSRARWAG